MRRQDILLLAAARQGSATAKCEIGRRYLLGVDGFSRHIATGLSYLLQSAVRDLPGAALTIAESLPLHDILSSNQLENLSRAAHLGSAAAQLKFGVWLMTSEINREEGLQWLRTAARQGEPGAEFALTFDRPELDAATATSLMLESLSQRGIVDAAEVVARAMNDAHAAENLDAMLWCLRIAAPWQKRQHPGMAEGMVGALTLAERLGRRVEHLPADFIASALELRSSQGDTCASYVLGRSLCGIPCARLEPRNLVRGTNVRKGMALLMRAANAGEAGAWMHLYRLSADNRCSVANPHMARLFLEKAATHGDGEARRKLGILLLRNAEDLAATEQALRWLHLAGDHGDALARLLLRSLVLPVPGSDADAQGALDLIRRSHPWLAARLSLARHFGLTRLEAMAVDPTGGTRPWGIVVGPNPFIRKARLAAARAVPAVSGGAMVALNAAVKLFAVPDPDGDLRQRVRVARTQFERHGIDESIFFAVASSTALDTLRMGPKWAYQVRGVLKAALQ